ncbi:MAG TPA: DUF1801 domain-containing protein [Lysobacter sp.]|nr:DUF1801 domain-containing protein [Lysobacter sp.]
MPAAATADDLIAAQPAPRSEMLAAARALVNAHLPPGYMEGVSGAMIVWEVPLAREPDTYNGKPLCYVALASQKAACSLYLMGPYMDPTVDAALRAAYARAGRKPDFGKSCLRFRRLEELLPEAVAQAVAAIPLERFVALHRVARR